MHSGEHASTEKKDPNQQFYEKAICGLKKLFERAKAVQELHFVMALMPEFRGAQDSGGILRKKPYAPTMISPV